MLEVKRHIYNARGGAPPYRGTYHTATGTVVLDPTKKLEEQEDDLMEGPSGKLFKIPKGKEPPSKWEDEEDCGQPVDMSMTAKDAFGESGDAFELVVLLPMRGMD